MSRYRYKNKSEATFWGIFGMLYYGALLGAVVFVIGYPIYQLIRGNMKGFKDNWVSSLFFLLFVLFIAVGVFFTDRKKK
jgi:hypothetical protein